MEFILVIDLFSWLCTNSKILCFPDMWKNPATLYSAYHDNKGVFERLVKNGMQNALSCIGYVPDEDFMQSWRYEVEINMLLRRVEMYITFPQGLNLSKHRIQIRPGEKILVVFSTKYNVDDINEVANKACWQVINYNEDPSSFCTRSSTASS
ncbi:hypothetical protein KI387_010847 [Taxus chinensis]|uniref:Histidine-specific methyltransferase SAM-dependent domain-containing protein n=1 Tax=Taxus chinensis TaxID=29808 RepID=A0AA38FNF3_TAXCH|nr:hypothetical protein KI387_010847 [Taxus chinensis]